MTSFIQNSKCLNKPNCCIYDLRASHYIFSHFLNEAKLFPYFDYTFSLEKYGKHYLKM